MLEIYETVLLKLQFESTPAHAPILRGWEMAPQVGALSPPETGHSDLSRAGPPAFTVLLTALSSLFAPRAGLAA